MSKQLQRLNEDLQENEEVTPQDVIEEVIVLVETGQANLGAAILRELLFEGHLSQEEYDEQVVYFKESHRVDMSNYGREL